MKKHHLFFVITLALFLCTIVPVSADPFSTRNFRELSVREYKTAYKADTTSLRFFESRVKLDIEPESLDADTDISAVKVDFDYHAPTFRKKGDIYSFSPHGLVFKKPVCLTLPYDDDGSFCEEDITIFYFNSDSGKFEPMQKVAQDTEANTVTCLIRHYSEYVPGVGSYSVNEGLSPNSIYFQNNNERVDSLTGNLYIDRVDLSFSGRGVDLVLKSQFSSERYYYNYKYSVSTWDFDSEIESKKIYKTANGWRWQLPAMRFAYIYDIFGNATGRTFYFYTPEGKKYELPILKVRNTAVDEIVTASGCRMYKTDAVVANGYRPVIELIEEKIVLCGDVLYPGTSNMQFNPWIYFPDGRIFILNSPTSGLKKAGNVKTIMDTSRLNSIAFTYDDAGNISQITDTIGRDFLFKYTSGYLTSVVYQDTEKGITPVTLNKYTNSGAKQIGFEQLVNTDGTTSAWQQTVYNYTSLTDMKINITYPSGGISEYAFGNLYVSGSTTCVVNPDVNFCFDSFTFRPVAMLQSIRENPAAPAKTIDYNYMGAKLYSPQGSGEEYVMGYYSLLKEKNCYPATGSNWRPWNNSAITYYTQQTIDDMTIYTVIVDGETISTPSYNVGNSGYCPMRSEIAEPVKKTAACYVFDSGVLKGVEKEITYVKSGTSWVIDKLTKNEYIKVNTYCDY